MRFTCSYLHRLTGETYFRTVWADCINEATKTAHRWCKEGYNCIKVESEY